MMKIHTLWFMANDDQDTIPEILDAWDEYSILDLIDEGNNHD